MSGELVSKGADLTLYTAQPALDGQLDGGSFLSAPALIPTASRYIA